VTVPGERLNKGTCSCFILLGVAAEAREEDCRGRATQINASLAPCRLHKFRYTVCVHNVLFANVIHLIDGEQYLRSLRVITDLMFMDKPKSTCAGVH